MTVGYCYDYADRLTSDSVASAPSGAGPLLAANLTSANLVYDSHGDITTLGNTQTMVYDQTGRHVSTTTSATSPSSTMTDLRGATDAVDEMTTTGATATDVRYSSGAGLQFTLNNTSTAANETTLSLTGSATWPHFGHTSSARR